MSGINEASITTLVPGTLDDAQAALKRGDSATALRLLRVLAVRGDAAAQLQVGMAYFDGEVIEQDYAAALHWFRQAADQGLAAAQFSTGWLYHNGKGVTRDYAEALRWYRLAAEQGDADSQCQVGVFYECAAGVEHDFAEAMRWLRLSADQGNAEAQFRIGCLYTHDDRGVAQDYAEAMRWFHLSADQGFWAARVKISECYEHGLGVPRDLAEAARWYMRACGETDDRTSAEAKLPAWLTGEEIAHPLTDAPTADDTGAMADIWEQMLNGKSEAEAKVAERGAAPRLASELEQSAMDGDGKAALAFGLELMTSPDPKVRRAGPNWIERAAELGVAEAQTRMADLLGSPSAWTTRMFGVIRDQDGAAWWRSVAAANEAWASRRKLAERGLSVVNQEPDATAPVVPVGDLTFEDIAQLGTEGILTLLRHVEPADWAWPLSPNNFSASSRLRHFVLAHMPKPRARATMRDLLAAEGEWGTGSYPRAEDRIVILLHELVDDGLLTLPPALAEDLWARDDATTDAPEGTPYDFRQRRKEFAAAHQRLARRTIRGEPMAPLENPTPGWYADHLGTQPNITIRLVLNSIGESHLFDFLAGSSPFLRFRIWQVGGKHIRNRFGYAALERFPSQGQYDEGKADIDAVLAGHHRVGELDWWPAADVPETLFSGAPNLSDIAPDTPDNTAGNASSISPRRGESPFNEEEEMLMREWAAMAGD